MQSIEGRDTDVVLTPSGNRLIVEFFNGIIDDVPEVDSFQVTQETRDAIKLALVPRPGFSVATQHHILEMMKNSGAHDLDVQIEVVERIPLTPGGKRRYVVSKVRQSELLTQ
jgi:phenylacetate-CoA ligase